MSKNDAPGYKNILLRLPEELAEILDERVREDRRCGLATSRNYLMVQAIEEFVTLREVRS